MDIGPTKDILGGCAGIRCPVAVIAASWAGDPEEGDFGGNGRRGACLAAIGDCGVI